MRKKTVTMIIISIFVAGLAITSNSNLATAAGKTQLFIATSSTGGSWYPAGAAMANIITNYVPNVEASAHPSAASRENIRLLEEKRSNLAMVMPDVAYFAATGTDVYEGKPPAKIKGLFSFWGIELLIITRADTDIYSIEDLKGRKVAFGPPGSGSEGMSKKILNAYGITYKDLNPQFIYAPEQAQALKDKSIDAAMYTIGTPAACFVELCSLTKCRIIPIKEDMMKKLLKKYPYYSRAVIPAGAYPQIDYDAPALKWLGVVATYDDLDKDTAYKVTKAICKDHLEELKQSHAMGKALTTTSMAQGMSIPWHPGAAKFWREFGVLK